MKHYDDTAKNNILTPNSFHFVHFEYEEKCIQENMEIR